MLTFKFKPDPAPQPEFENYAPALRAIGQDLTELYPEELEIEVKDNMFWVTGVGLAPASEAQENPTKVLNRVWKRLKDQKANRRASAAQRSREPFTRQYDLDAINLLDERGLGMRMNKGGKPDIYSLGERLRTIGRIVDACGGALIRIVKDRNSVKFDYRDRHGIDHREEYTNLALYKYQQRYYAERGTFIFIDPWDSKID
jgi:hypothetical protein